MRFYATLTKLKVDGDKLTKATKKLIRDTFAEAAVHFIEKTAPAIPVDTGMARGSFLNMQAYLQNKGYSPRVNIPTRPQRTRKNGQPLRYRHTDGRGLPKTPKQGALLSTPSSQIFRFVDSKIQFEFNSEVKHLNLNERLATRVPGTPWHVFSRGRIAFLREIRDMTEKMPRIEQYIVMTVLTPGKKSPFATTFRERSQRKFP